MGYSIRPGTQIKDFWPDNTETQLYIESSENLSLTELLEKAQQYFGTKENISVYAKTIHTHCITYDYYDSTDYTDFIVLCKSN